MEKDEMILSEVKGNGIHDDTAGIQAALDSGAGKVYLPKPTHHYLIRKTLRIHSRQTLVLDRQATIRLADKADVPMLTNADHEKGNEGITVIGGIWDANNANQTLHDFSDWKHPFDPARWIGIGLQFNHVRDLRIAHLTVKDPESFGIQLGNLRRFTIEDITFDYNQLRLNMDGVHLNGDCHQGRITNLKGATNDDMVALNADDGAIAEMTRGPIDDIEIDGIFAENGYAAVRLLSAGSPVSRVRISNIYGSFRYQTVYFSHHDVHPGSPSVFADVVIDGVFCSKPPLSAPVFQEYDKGARIEVPLIWVAAGTLVKNLHIKNLQRTETLPKAPDMIVVDQGATVDYLGISDVSLSTTAGGKYNLLTNRGTIQALNMANVYGKGLEAGFALENSGTIHQKNLTNITAAV
jgi:hypothetical protein